MKKRLIPGLACAALLTAGLASCGETGTNPTEWTWENAVADGELGYIVLVGEDGNPEAEDRTKGCVDALNEIAKRIYAFENNFITCSLLNYDL